MPIHTTVPVRLGDRSYPIIIGRNILPKHLIQHPLFSHQGTRVFVVSDSRVKSIAKDMIRGFSKRCVGSFFLPGGERTKNISTLISLYQAASRARLDRQSVIIAIGGGVIGDVTGFFAATYLRGIQIVHIPTTLIAQIDSAIGGKTGINLPSGKNLVGAFHQPSLVMTDLAVLKTLPEREFCSGLAEAIKYGIIADANLFHYLESNMGKILKRDSIALSWVIRRCCAIKARVVSKDECETSGLRAILNFGHTIGHGIEAAAGYTLLHGEAIALGIIGAVHLSQRVMKLSSPSAGRIYRLIQRMGLPIHLKKPLVISQILTAMQLDKKRVQGQLRFILARRIGSVKTGISIPKNLVKETLEVIM